MDFAKFSYFNAPKIDTGIISLDVVLGGGYTKGDVIEFHSPSGVGKSTVCLQLVKNFLARGQRCAYMDVETGVKKDILDKMELSDKVGTTVGDSFLLLSPTTYKDIEEVFAVIYDIDEKGKKKGYTPYDHIFVDSITQLIPSSTRDRPIEDAEPGKKSRLQAVFIEKYKPCSRETGTVMWLINQMRVKLDFSFGGKSEEDSAGGHALKFGPDVRIRFDKGPVMKRSEKTIMGEKDVVYGNYAHIWAVKNRAERPEIKVMIPILFGRGVSNVLMVKEILMQNKIISGGTGGFFKVNWNGKEETVRGTDDLTKWVRDNIDELKKFLNDSGMLKLTDGV